MPCDLEVDTDQIGRSAALLLLAAWCAAQPTDFVANHPGPQVSADGSAMVREALRLATTRSEQSVAASDALAAHTAELAGRLRKAAQAFDTVEALCAAGG